MMFDLKGIIEAIAGLHPTVQMVAILVGFWLIQGGYLIVKKQKNRKNDKEKNSRGDLTDHSSCVNFPSLLLLVKNAIDKMAEIQRIQINITISEQMTEFDDLFIDFRKILKSNYMKLYREKSGKSVSGLLNEKDVQHYVSILMALESPLKGVTRRFLKKNHFVEKSEEEFKNYILERTEDYQNEIGDYLDEHYDTNHFLISREELFDSNMKNCREELYKKVDKFFYKVRTISKEKQNEIIKLEEHIEDFV